MCSDFTVLAQTALMDGKASAYDLLMAVNSYLKAIENGTIPKEPFIKMGAMRVTHYVDRALLEIVASRPPEVF